MLIADPRNRKRFWRQESQSNAAFRFTGAMENRSRFAISSCDFRAQNTYVLEEFWRFGSVNAEIASDCDCAIWCAKICMLCPKHGNRKQETWQSAWWRLPLLYLFLSRLSCLHELEHNPRTWMGEIGHVSEEAPHNQVITGTQSCEGQKGLTEPKTPKNSK